MASPQERRAFPRSPFDLPAQAYENGARFACKPVDLSLGGAFLRTRDLASFQPGALVSVVFSQDSGWEQPVYLFARIVRCQPAPTGLGLAWERAVSTGDAAYLASFLHRVLGLKTSVAESHARSAAGRFRSVFSFDLVQRSAEQHWRKLAEHEASREAAEVSAAADVVAVGPAAPAPVAPPPQEATTPASAPTTPKTPAGRSRATRSIVSRLADSRARTAGLDHAGTLNPFDERTPTPHEGVITGEVRANEQPVPTRVDALLEIDGATYPATISRLGSTRLTVVAVTAPAHVPSHVRLAADLPAQEGPRPIVADCAVHGFERDGERTIYSLAIDDLDEDGDPGVLARYVKWLYFEALAGKET